MTKDQETIKGKVGLARPAARQRESVCSAMAATASTGSRSSMTPSTSSGGGELALQEIFRKS